MQIKIKRMSNNNNDDGRNTRGDDASQDFNPQEEMKQVEPDISRAQDLLRQIESLSVPNRLLSSTNDTHFPTHQLAANNSNPNQSSSLRLALAQPSLLTGQNAGLMLAGMAPSSLTSLASYGGASNSLGSPATTANANVVYGFGGNGHSTKLIHNHFHHCDAGCKRG